MPYQLRFKKGSVISHVLCRSLWVLPLLTLSVSSLALADDWPDSPLEIVVPFDAGGSARPVGSRVGRAYVPSLWRAYYRRESTGWCWRFRRTYFNNNQLTEKPCLSCRRRPT